ncbi:flagellar hook-associated protein FlgK [Defluviitalea saccharophila]|uniref:Flagellar hook-associated protein 1 n=1 Tax=Defluviitalea saccharophila TaxID=879970 RepID=A0ABZ2Y7R4_9FIRM
MASLSRAISGLNASQMGLNVTGHNLTNVNTPGYVRQQVLQNDSFYMTIGRNGNDLLSIGFGVDITEIRQIRDSFLDRNYRTEIGGYQFYNAKQSTILEVESILGEINGESLSEVMTDFWRQTNKLATAPDGLDERKAFIQSASVFIDKVNHIANQLNSYQFDLNNQVIDTVQTINSLSVQIRDLNEEIARYEINGDHANDLRDKRNNILDELAGLIDIQYSEDATGRVQVKAEGHLLVHGKFVNKMKLVQTQPMSPFVKPVWEDTGEDVIKMNREITSGSRNDIGKLKGLLLSRGNAPANYATDWSEITLNDNKTSEDEGNCYLIPKIQKEFDTLIHSIVTTINDILAPTDQTDPNAPMGQDTAKTKFMELFSRKSVTRYDTTQNYIAEDPNDPNTLYSAGNLVINPALLNDGGYNLLPLSRTGDVGDDSVVQEILSAWDAEKTKIGNNHSLNFQDYYAEFVTRIGTEGNEVIQRVQDKQTVVNHVDNLRNSMSAVSMDEEMSNMMKYQHAYNASARVVNAVDSMIDTIVNRMGVVGR